MSGHSVVQTCGIVMVKFALKLPAGTVTPPCGTIDWPLTLPLRKTTAPLPGAGEVSVTVAVAVPPPSTLDWWSVKEERLGAGSGAAGGRNTIEDWGARNPPASVAVSMVTRVAAETALVGMMTVASVPPAGMKTVAGTVTRLLSLLISRTVAPPAGAGLFRTIVAVIELPPITLSLLRPVPKRIGPRPIDPSCDTWVSAATIVPTPPGPGSKLVGIGKTSASVLPGGMVTVAGMSISGR